METFVAIILFLPIIVVLILTAIYPRESALFGMRWKFKNEDLEPSDAMIKYNRVSSIISLIVIVLIFITSFFRGD